MDDAAKVLRSTLDSIGEGVVVADEHGRFVVFNPAAERIVGLGPTDIPLADWVRTYGVYLPDGTTFCPTDELPLVQAMRGESCDEVELVIRNARRPEGVRVSATARPLLDERRAVRGGVLIFRDITKRRQAEQAMAESQRLLELFFSQSLDGFFFMMLDEPVRWDDTVDKDVALEWAFDHQRITNVNDAMLAQYGATRGEFVGLTPRDFFAHDLAHGKAVWRQFLDAGRLHVETQERRLGGAPIHIEGDYICLYDAQGRITGHFGIQRDVTERHLAAEAIRRSREELRALATRLQSIREEEQRRIAREIHDELGQALTGLKMDLAWLAGHVPGRTPELGEWAGTVAARVDETIAMVRRIATELRPSVLDHLGLVAAVEWLAGEFERRTGIAMRLTLPPDVPELEDARATTVFRILQEALTNVARHSGATEVAVTLRVDGELALEVRDNGRGLPPARTPGEPWSLGLVGMRERAIACGGEVRIRTHPGEGTAVVAILPLTTLASEGRRLETATAPPGGREEEGSPA